MTEIKPTQIIKDQHYAPRFYFKRFANDVGNLEVLKLKDGVVGKPKHYKAVCKEEFFYAQKTGQKDDISQEMEKSLGQIENRVAAKLTSIIDSIYSTRALTEDEISYLSGMMSMLWMRSKNLRVNMAKSLSDSRKQMLRIHAGHPSFLEYVRKASSKELTDQQIEEVRDFFISGHYEIEVDNTHHLHMMSKMEEFANIFEAKKWRIHISRGEAEFVTSDTPLVEWVHPKQKSFWGVDIFERKQYLALTPKILIELIDPNLPGKHIKRVSADEAEVLQFNLIRASGSLEHAYSRKRDELDAIAARKKSSPTGKSEG